MPCEVKAELNYVNTLSTSEILNVLRLNRTNTASTNAGSAFDFVKLPTSIKLLIATRISRILASVLLQFFFLSLHER